MTELAFDKYIEHNIDEYEIGFRSRLPDGTPTNGKLRGLADHKPPTIIFEESKLDGIDTVIREFDHGTPENVRSVFRIPGMAEHFVGMIRLELESLISREIIKE